MKIGIIGSGNIGGALARRLTSLGYEVWIANSRGPESLADLARETGAHPATVAEAAHAGDVAIVTIPQKNVPDLPHDLFADVPADVVVIDTGNSIRSNATARSRASRRRPRKAPGSRVSSAAPSSKRSTTSKRCICSSTESPPGRPDASRFRSRATIPKRRPSSQRSSTISASMSRTRGASTSRGASSPERPCTAPTSISRGRARRSPPRSPSARRNGARANLSHVRRPVDVDRRPGRVVGTAAREEGHDPRDVFGRTDPA